MKALIEIKKKIQSKLPKFSRKDSHKKSRLGTKWRKPKGLQNKMRLQKRAHKPIVKSGYGTPASLRHTDDKGLRSITVSSMKMLKTIDAKIESVVVSKSVSKKTLAEMLQYCIDNKITVDNLDASKKVAEIKKAYDEKKKAKSDKVKARDAKKAELDKKSKEAEKKAKEAEKEVTKEEKEEKAEEKAKEEKKEKDKVLTSKKA